MHRAFNSKGVSYRWIGEKYLEKFRRQPDMALTDIVSWDQRGFPG